MKTLLMILGITAILGASEGSALYKKCAACHGADGEKKALGKSKVIKEMSKEEIVTAVNGYKDGSYGGPMKALMKGQVAGLNEDDTNSLAEYITSK